MIKKTIYSAVVVLSLALTGCGSSSGLLGNSLGSTTGTSGTSNVIGSVLGSVIGGGGSSSSSGSGLGGFWEVCSIAILQQAY